MDSKILRQAIDTYGVSNQLMQTAEECAELIQAINKYFRAVKNQQDIQKAIHDMAGEVADVSVMLEQMKMMIGYKAVEEMADRKVERLAKRLQKKEA